MRCVDLGQYKLLGILSLFFETPLYFVLKFIFPCFEIYVIFSSFLYQCNLGEPGIMHIKKLLYYGDACRQMLTPQLTLNSHPCLRSTQQLHTCDMCSKSFSSRSVLKTHCAHIL